MSERLRTALVEARVQVAELQRRLGIVDTGYGTLSIIDAALATPAVPAKVQPDTDFAFVDTAALLAMVEEHLRREPPRETLKIVAESVAVHFGMVLAEIGAAGNDRTDRAEAGKLIEEAMMERFDDLFLAPWRAEAADVQPRNAADDAADRAYDEMRDRMMEAAE